MEIKVNALVLRAVDYGENDKILTLLTAENGKITAGIKGVKKAGAKLKFAAQPFCFAEYILTSRGNKYTVINASECESFYEIRCDILKYYAASAVIEAANSLTYEGAECAEIFTECIKALTRLCMEGENDALIEFLLYALKKSGYGIALDNCTECGAELIKKDKLRFDLDMGAFTCFECGRGAGASRVTYNVLRKTENKSYEKDFITPDGQKRALRLIREYFSHKLGVTFNSLSEYIRLL